MVEEHKQPAPREISHEMRNSFLDYAMSVIVARALPDVRDGLKPVHRRILYGMNELGVTPDKPYKKSARIVGDVMGKYHPHGDSAIYESMVRMAQDFSYRYMLVDGHGNFGSVDGDQAAAMRYTEARLSKIALEMVRDINKKTVDFIPNYDGEEREPEVLPSRFPNLLVNGATGIAVGMTTNIPPHNLSEVIQALHILMKNPKATTQDLMEAIPGPDFPTAGIVIGKAGIKKAYETGKGRIIVRARAEIDTMASGKERIIVSEIPYMVNKAKLVERIADLARDKRIDGITAVRDETGRQGMRIVIECRKDASASVILNNLFKQTQMQTNFNFNMVAIDQGVPRTLSLKQILNRYLDHQEEIIRRRSIFEKEKAEARAHILEGLQIALDHIDEIVNILRSSKTGDQAKSIFMDQYGLSDKQAQAILDMRLVRLTGLEREKIDNEHQDLMEEIAYLNEVLASEEKRYEIIYQELLEIEKRFGDERRTEIRVGEITNLEDEDLIEESNVLITLSRKGYIKRVEDSEYRTQNRGGRGVKGMALQDGDYIDAMLSTSTHDVILCFTDRGRVFQIKGYEIPEYGRAAKGLPIVNLLNLQEDEQVRGVINVTPSDKAANTEDYFFFVTKQGRVKRTPIEEYFNIRNNGLIAINLRDDDELVAVLQTSGQDNIILGSRQGYAVSFAEDDVRSMGRTATGVRGIRLDKDDYVVGASILGPDQDVLIVTEKGYGKRTPADEYSIKHRGGKGVKTVNITEKNGPLVGLATVDLDEDIMLMTDEGVVIRFHSVDISQTGRATQGVRLMRLDEAAHVSTMAVVDPEDDEEALKEAETVEADPDQQGQYATETGLSDPDIDSGDDQDTARLSQDQIQSKMQDFSNQLLEEDDSQRSDED
ncbi:MULTISPECIES: DNA gyrase subunit A [Aerococcus]|uniref:DNA gyrase subunit A n=1 Tax=Aerococcus loyolae TaxID=2976809 RepID=A0ABT4BXR8_9LACT|nr:MULTISPECIES: DNA gyrase subunit A [Aerococcus]KAA9220679.1 DNA gyrase subunit A [Aerococcus loyolae]KAA9265400.1 DNA gyrase subunit A [Aerococcus loyolae]MCY3025062.1 DNA gyrase subunit A [Aerococcus loyolae]MCY3026881.1 DNA gyrase subunit A [Aerococcus loyolae]MCY3028466.1 DNA gyrase subunit A [Aerococcus loyolae]